jgi:hypothetical protein
MTKFEREHFDFFGGYLTYGRKLGNRRFVARFKYNRSGLAGWTSFMIKNIPVEEYFAHLDAGNAPLTILEAYGYVSPQVKRMIKEGRWTMGEFQSRRQPLKEKGPVVAPAPVVSAQQAFVEAILAA